MRPAVDASQTSSEPESAVAAALVLPEALDSSSVGSIKELLLARRGEPIVVDAGQVRRTGMQAVQVLISAAQTWQADGQSYVLSNPTQEFLDTLALVGLSREQLLVEGCLG
ncbi:MAG: STAS domain-containing protein [Proteobacteria bacterium]|nr:STAS domain-containing protein [Pseudomonadota bacterium]